MSQTNPGLAPIFAALGDPVRLELVSRLSDGEQRSITQLAEGLSLTRQGVTKHLQVLSQVGIVSQEQAGREKRFAIKPESIAPARDYLQRASAQWDAAIARLKLNVEG